MAKRNQSFDRCEVKPLQNKDSSASGSADYHNSKGGLVGLVSQGIN